MAISRQDRAKQFLPFDSLKGFREELIKREKKIEAIEKKELSQEEIENISDFIKTIEENDLIKVIYYKDGKYETIKQNIEYIDYKNKKIILKNGVKINFIDILKIEKTIK